MLAAINLAAVASAPGYAVTATPCAENGWRVQVELSTLPPKTATAYSALKQVIADEGLLELPGAFLPACTPDASKSHVLDASKPGIANGNLMVALDAQGHIAFTNVAQNGLLTTVTPSLAAPSKPVADGYLNATLSMAAGDKNEKIYGLGQGGWTGPGGCPGGNQTVVPIVRNGQTVDLLQTKFHVTIPTVVSSAGYSMVFNMPGYGSVKVGDLGVGGMEWNAQAAIFLDFWISGLPASPAHPMQPLLTQYADATGHSPPLREKAMIFWQSRNRYKSSKIAMSIAERYAKLNLPVGVLVIDYKNQVHDGDFSPDATCFPSVSDLSSGITKVLNASTVFSFWPEVLDEAREFFLLNDAGCLINSALGGHTIESTKAYCRELIWQKFLKPRYYDQGVNMYWLDETDGEGTDKGYDQFNGGYATQFGPKAFASNLWVNQYISIFTEPVRRLGEEEPLVLVRGVWAGGQRHGVVLWSSDIWSNFETLAAMVPQGVHASMSGIPWWTTDVGGYGCGVAPPTDQPYMRELIVRWYQFGLFSPIFRTHGCRNGPQEPDEDPCHPKQGSCGMNEVWSYGDTVQAMLVKYVKLRATRLLPYIKELAANVTAHGVPTMRPLSYDFPADAGASAINDQYMLGPELLVAPVVTGNATSRKVYFPCVKSAGDTKWQSYWDASVVVPCGPAAKDQPAPLDTIPVFKRM